MEDVARSYDLVDDPDVLDHLDGNPALQFALQSARHPNWWGTGASSNLLVAAREQGVPLAWVPRRELIRLLSASSPKGDLLHTLVSHRGEVLEDCRRVLDECTHEWLASDTRLAKEALRAVVDGYGAAGMALAVCVSEPLALWASTPRILSFEGNEERGIWERSRPKGKKYQWAVLERKAAGEDFSRPEHFRYQVLIAPIPRFFTSWYPNQGAPLPEHLSRHVVAHQPSLDHFTSENALLAIMLVTSLLREQQDWAGEVKVWDNP